MFRTMYTEGYMADLAYDHAYPMWKDLMAKFPDDNLI
jgi:hypothetical protein